MTIARRDFLKAAPVAALAVASAAKAAPFLFQSDVSSADSIASRNKIEPFDHAGVTLRDSHWQKQLTHARDFYLKLPNDDILHGFRVAAGLPSSGKPLGGWAARSTGGIFGQWLSGMARIYRATGDKELRDKAALLMTEWGKTLRPNDMGALRHYAFDKFMCGLVDMHRYADHPDALPLAEKLVDAGMTNMSHENIPARGARGGYSGRPSEWYTLGENLFRAYEVSGKDKFKEFAQVWLYPAYWNKFAESTSPTDANGVHAYSHVNTFSSCAMAYAVLGDQQYLKILKNFYDFLQNKQCYATGGYGPSETTVTSDGGLGRSLETRTDSFETVCGSWAGFKMARYLQQFTGDARYGDWMERLVYNGFGSALPIADGGRNFYYADYRASGGMKVYNWEFWTCCSGTYLQCASAFHNMIYYKDTGGVYVNLFMPSEVTWKSGRGDVKLVQETGYPAEDSTRVSIEVAQPTSFALRFRVPEWAKGTALAVNGETAGAESKPGTWAAVHREWKNGDKVEFRVPQTLRMQPIDPEHPKRVAVVRGAVVLVAEAAYLDPIFRLPETDDELNNWAKPDTAADTSTRPPSRLPPGCYRLTMPDGTSSRSRLRPFDTVGENFPYRMYFDRDKLPVKYT